MKKYYVKCVDLTNGDSWFIGKKYKMTYQTHDDISDVNAGYTEQEIERMQHIYQGMYQIVKLNIIYTGGI